MKNIAPAVEIVQFRLSQGRDERAFLAASDAMMADLRKQPGFISRELLKLGGGEWMDIVHWESIEDAEAAEEAVMTIPSCLAFFGMIDQASIRMMHVEQLKEYTAAA
jgi:quinol monooxygenase YgiN